MRPLPRTLIALKGHSRVAYVDDERWDDNGYWVHLEYGWINPFTETHSIHEDTVKEVMEQFKNIEPCACDECKRHMNNATN